MAPLILEIAFCLVAAVFGIVAGNIAGDVTIVLVIIYLSQLAEFMGGKGSELACKILSKLIYLAVMAQVVVSIYDLSAG